jgi:hypothetical protein
VGAVKKPNEEKTDKNNTAEKPKRPSKYDTNVKPYLDAIAAWTRNGVIDKDIAKALKVAYSTFREYIRQNPELKAVMRDGKEIADLKVENSFFKSTQGFYVEELKGFKCKEKYYDKQGRLCEKEHVETAIETRFIKPEDGLILAWLFNRKPDVWKNKQIVQMVATGLSNFIKDQLGDTAGGEM